MSKIDYMKGFLEGVEIAREEVEEFFETPPTYADVLNLKKDDRIINGIYYMCEPQGFSVEQTMATIILALHVARNYK